MALWSCHCEAACMECNIIYGIGEHMCLIHPCSVGCSGKPVSHLFQHFPSFHVQCKTCSEMLHLGWWQGLGKRVSNHVIGWAIYESQGALLNDPANEIIAHIDVLRARVVLVVSSEGNCCLVVREEGGGWFDGVEHLRQEASQPEGLLHAVGHCIVLTLGGGQEDNLLPLERSWDGPSIDEECVACHGTPILIHVAICVSISFEGSLGLYISQPEVACAKQIVKDSLNCPPVGRTRVFYKTSDGGDCESDVGMSGKGGPVKCPNSLTVRLIAHNHVLSHECARLLSCEANGGVHGG